jgi:hypothetical protein
MTDKEREIVRLLYDLELELFHEQGEAIAGLRRALESTQRSHEILGRLLKATGELMGVS